MSLEHRKGYFQVSSVMAKGKQLPVLAKILATLEFVPFKVEFEYAIDSFVYCGCSPKFRELDFGETIPYYQILVENIDGQMIVRAEEKDYNDPSARHFKFL
jgi:hypothetical protein